MKKSNGVNEVQNALTNNSCQKLNAFEILFGLKINENLINNTNSMMIQEITARDDIERLISQSIETANGQNFQNLRITIIRQLNLKTCLMAEEMFRNYLVMFLDHDNPRNDTDIGNKRSLFGLVQKLYEEDARDDDSNQIRYHLYLSQLTRRMLTRPEFDTIFESHPSMVDRWKEQLWWHNTHCPVFFNCTFQEIFHSIRVIKEHIETLSDLAKVAQYILKMIRIIQENRANFEFCTECRLNDPSLCKFWEDVTFTINQCDLTTEETYTKGTLKKYFTELEIPSKCPINIGNLE